jgi:hypothetical protein
LVPLSLARYKEYYTNMLTTLRYHEVTNKSRIKA